MGVTFWLPLPIHPLWVSCPFCGFSLYLHTSYCVSCYSTGLWHCGFLGLIINFFSPPGTAMMPEVLVDESQNLRKNLRPPLHPCVRKSSLQRVNWVPHGRALSNASFSSIVDPSVLREGITRPSLIMRGPWREGDGRGWQDGTYQSSSASFQNWIVL